jgi:hypothetical protein
MRWKTSSTLRAATAKAHSQSDVPRAHTPNQIRHAGRQTACLVSSARKRTRRWRATPGAPRYRLPRQSLQTYWQWQVKVGSTIPVTKSRTVFQKIMTPSNPACKYHMITYIFLKIITHHAYVQATSASSAISRAQANLVICEIFRAHNVFSLFDQTPFSFKFSDSLIIHSTVHCDPPLIYTT